MNDLHFVNETEWDAADLRKMFSAFNEGVLDLVGGHLEVTNGASGLSIDVAAGVGFVEGDFSADQGFYRVAVLTDTNSAAFLDGSIEPAHATLPRIDSVIARVYDDEIDSSGETAFRLEMLTGTATAGANLTNETGKATVPDTAMLLALVLVDAAATSIDPGDVEDKRVSATADLGGGGGGLNSIDDFITTVSPVTDLILNSGATVTDVGGGVANLDIICVRMVTDDPGLVVVDGVTRIDFSEDSVVDLTGGQITVATPSADEKAALAGTDGTPAALNPYVTDSDPRLPAGVPLEETIIDAKGDLIAGDAADSAARLAVGTNGKVLTADSAEATGLKWETPAAGGLSEALLDAVGDLIVASADNTAARLPKGTNGQVLVVDTAETLDLKWADPALVLPERAVATYTTASLADDAAETGNMTLAKSFRLLQIDTDVAARVQLYATAGDRTADAARPIGTDPTGDHGVILDFATTPGDVSWRFAPVVDGSSMDGPPVATIAMRVTNISGATDTVTVDLTYLATEQ